MYPIDVVNQLPVVTRKLVIEYCNKEGIEVGKEIKNYEGSRVEIEIYKHVLQRLTHHKEGLEEAYEKYKGRA